LEKGDSHSSRDEPFTEAPRRKFRFALGDFGVAERVGELNRLGPPIIRIAQILEFDRVPAKRRVDIRPAVIVLVIDGVRKHGKERCSTFVNLVVLKTDPDRLCAHSIYLPRSVSIPPVNSFAGPRTA
jgi:hypothetical protein